MKFPIKFKTPAEAVRAIYVMKQSNPSAIITVNVKTNHIDFSMHIPFAYSFAISWHYLWDLISCDVVKDKVVCKHTGSAIETPKWEVKSITIKSIQSAEPRLQEKDRVFHISSNKMWEVSSIDDRRKSYLVFYDDESFEFCRSRDLIKLPSNIQTDV